MGWRNMFINLNSSSDDFSTIDRVVEFVNHHNNFTEFFNQDDVKKMEETDEIPGEELFLKILKHNKNYWAYLGSCGGIGHSFEWKDKYFPEIVIYDSSNFKHYNDGWTKWPIMDLDEYIKKKIL